MEHLLLSLAGTPANALTFIIALGILVIQLADKGLLGFRIGKRETLGKRMDYLIEYVNHRETEKLDKLIEISTETNLRETEKLDKLIEISTETNLLIREMAKYGITCRKE